jgi:hypothetical protein
MVQKARDVFGGLHIVFMRIVAFARIIVLKNAEKGFTASVAHHSADTRPKQLGQIAARRASKFTPSTAGRRSGRCARSSRPGTNLRLFRIPRFFMLPSRRMP